MVIKIKKSNIIRYYVFLFIRCFCCCRCRPSVTALVPSHSGSAGDVLGFSFPTSIPLLLTYLLTCISLVWKFDSDYYTYAFLIFRLFYLCDWLSEMLKHSCPSGTPSRPHRRKYPSWCFLSIFSVANLRSINIQYKRNSTRSFHTFYFHSCIFRFSFHINAIYDMDGVRARSSLCAHGGLAVSHARKPYCWCLIRYAVLRLNLLTKFTTVKKERDAHDAITSG